MNGMLHFWEQVELEEYSSCSTPESGIDDYAKDDGPGVVCP